MDLEVAPLSLAKFGMHMAASHMVHSNLWWSQTPILFPWIHCLFVLLLCDGDGWLSARPLPPSCVPVYYELSLVWHSGSWLCKLPASNRKCLVFLLQIFRHSTVAGPNGPLPVWKRHREIFTPIFVSYDVIVQVIFTDGVCSATTPYYPSAQWGE